MHAHERTRVLSNILLRLSSQSECRARLREGECFDVTAYLLGDVKRGVGEWQRRRRKSRGGEATKSKGNGIELGDERRHGASDL